MNLTTQPALPEALRVGFYKEFIFTNTLLAPDTFNFFLFSFQCGVSKYGSENQVLKKEKQLLSSPNSLYESKGYKQKCHYPK